jgi:hypothetical protein
MVAALATVSPSVGSYASLEVLVGQAALGARGWQATDQHRDRGGGYDAERDADGEGGAQEQHHEDEVDGQHRHLAGQEAAQHVELAQPFGDHARWGAFEMAIRKLHQMVHDFGAHQRIEPGTGAGRQPTARHARKSRAHKRRACWLTHGHQRGHSGRADDAALTTIMKSGVARPRILISNEVMASLQ